MKILKGEEVFLKMRAKENNWRIKISKSMKVMNGSRTHRETPAREGEGLYVYNKHEIKHTK